MRSRLNVGDIVTVNTFGNRRGTIVDMDHPKPYHYTVRCGIVGTDVWHEFVCGRWELTLESSNPKGSGLYQWLTVNNC